MVRCSWLSLSWRVVNLCYSHVGDGGHGSLYPDRYHKTGSFHGPFYVVSVYTKNLDQHSLYQMLYLVYKCVKQAQVFSVIVGNELLTRELRSSFPLWQCVITTIGSNES